MEEIDQKKENKFIIFLKDWYFLILLILAIIVAYIIVNYYISRFDECLLFGGPDTFGVFGDFIGGILNPTLAFFSLIALLITIRIQSKELKNSTEELAKSSEALTEQSKSLKIQNFETTFFNMLSLHNEIVKNIQFDKHIFFNYVRVSNKYDYNKIIPYKNIMSIENQDGRNAIKDILVKIDKISLSNNHPPRVFTFIYNQCQNNLQGILGHYFGNIYQILKLISTDKNILDKRKYSNLFRAQFSSTELKLLFYHCSGEIGSRKFKKYMEKFNFFEHLIIEENNNFKYILFNSIYKTSAFGKKMNIEYFISKWKIENQKWLEEFENEKDEITINTKRNDAIIKYYQNGNFNSALELMEKFRNITTPENMDILIKDIQKLNSSSQEQQ